MLSFISRLGWFYLRKMIRSLNRATSVFKQDYKNKLCGLEQEKEHAWSQIYACKGFFVLFELADMCSLGPQLSKSMNVNSEAVRHLSHRNENSAHKALEEIQCQQRIVACLLFLRPGCHYWVIFGFVVPMESCQASKIAR